MPIEFDDQSLRIIGYNVKALQFYDDSRVLQQEIYLQSDDTLNIGDTDTASGAGGSLTTHALDGSAHVGVLASSQAPQFLLKDGTRNIEGNLGVDAGKTIDGVDISAHAANVAAHHGAFIALEDNAGTVISPAGDYRVQITDDGVINADAAGNTLALSITQGQIDHGSIGGLGDDDHSWAVHISNARTITAQHSFSPASAQAPFTLSANAQSQLVTGLRADQLNKSVSAGNGLTGGGGLTASITVTLGTPSTTTVGTSNAVTGASHTHQLDLSGRTLTAGSGLTGGGTLAANRTFNVGAGDGINVAANSIAVDVTDLIGTGLSEDGNNNLILPTPGTLSVSSTNAAAAPHTHTVTSSSNPGAAAALLATDANGYLRLIRLGIGISPTTPLEVAGTARIDGDLQFVGAQSITTTAGDLTVVPTGDLILDPAGSQVRMASGVTIQSNDFASQTTGWGISYTGSGDLRYLFVDEMHAKSFIADLEQALAGGQIICKSVAVVGKDFSIPTAGNTAYLWVEDLPSASDMAVFQANDIVRLRKFTRSAGSLTIADAWGVVTAYTDGTGGDDGLQRWTFTRSSGGDAGSATGTIETGSLVLDYGTTGNGFYEVNAIDGAWAENSPYSQIVTWTTHPHSGKTVRVRTGNLKGITAITEYGMFAGDGVAATNKFFRVSDQNFEIHNLAVELYDVSTKTIALNPTALSLALGNPIPTAFATGEGIWMGKDTTYKFRVGDPAGERVQWDPTNGLYIYDGDNQAAFYAKPDGSVWMSQLAISEQAGDFLFSQAEGLLLLGPGCEITPTSWTSLHGQAAALSGAFHQGAGAFPGTRGVWIERSTVNLYANPSAETNTTGWACNNGALTRSSDYARFGDYSFKCVFTPAGGDESFYDSTHPKVNPGQAETYTASFWVYATTATVGKTVTVNYREHGGAQALQQTSENYTLVPGWQRIWATHTILQADRTGADANVLLLAAANNDTLYFDGCQFEEVAFPTSVAIGGMGTGYTLGDPCTRTATVVSIDFDDIGLDCTAGSTGTVSIWAWKPSWHNWDNTNANEGIFGVDYDDSNRLQAYCQLGASTVRFQWEGNGNDDYYDVSASTWAGWIQFGIAWDFTGGNTDVHYILNGQIIRTISDADPFTNNPTDNFYIGRTRAGGDAFNGVAGEVAILGNCLTAEQFAALYARHAPLVDAGALEKPGVYILDGQFNLASSTSGTHVEIEAAGIGIYAGTGPTGVGRLLGGFVDTSGKVLDITSTDLGWFGYDSSNVLQVAWYGSGTNAGKIVAAAGKLTIDSTGVILDTAPAALPASYLQWNYDGTDVCELRSYYTGSAGSASKVTTSLWATGHESGDAPYAEIVLYAKNYDGSKTIEFTLDPDSALATLTKSLYINEIANAKQTLGLTINQGANDDEIIALKSSDVAHGATDFTETDTYGRIRKYSASAGGLYISGYRDSDDVAHTALAFAGFLAENVDTTKSTSGRAIVEIIGHQTSGASIADTVANGNVLTIRTRRGGSLVTTAIFDEDGDFYYDGTLTNYDDEDDALAAWDLSHVLSGAWEQIVEYNAARLEKMGIIGPLDRRGKRMVSNKRMSALLLGAVGQLYHRIIELEAQ
jgi:hypothetical protein